MIEEELSPVYATPEQEQNPTPEVQFPTELPKEVPNTMLDILNEPTNELVNEQREQQEKEQQAKAEERRMAMGSIEAELVVDKDRTEQEKARIVGNFIKESSGSVPRNMGQFEAGMDKVWSGLGGEGIAPNINAVFDKLQQKSISNKKTNDKAQDMFKRGTRSVFTRDAQDPTFELMTTPMSKEERKQFSEAYKIGVKRQNERYGARNIAHYHTVREDIDSGIDFDIISEDIADFTVDMSGAEKSNYLSGLQESINDYPTEKRDQLIDKIGKNARISLERAGDFVTDSTKTAIKSVRAAAAGFFNESQKETNPIAQRAQLMYETSLHYTDMERSVKDILMSEVEPLDYVTDENSIGRTFEDAAYAVPQVAVSVATIAAPMILGGVLGAGGLALNLARGTSAAAGFNMSASEIMESKRQGYLQGGADFDTASNKAAGLSTYAQALPHYFIERMKVGQLTRKSGVMNSIMGKLDNSVRPRGLRYLAKAGVQGVVQTAEEMGQNIYTEFVKDVTNVLDSEMADVVWSNGEDGVFDEFWAESAVTFLTMAPFAVWSAGGLMSAENRAAQWAKLPELHLKAYGYDEQSIANLKNANSPRERTLAHSDAEDNKNGKSEGAKEAVDEINKALLNQQEAIQQAQYNGDFPLVKVSSEEGKPTYRVYEPKSENLMLETDNPDEATESAMGWVDDKADAEDARFIFLNTLMKASARMTEKDPDSVKMLDTGEVMTRIKALAENPDQARRLAEQAEMAEIASGGDGSLARLQFGQPIYGSNQVKIDETGQAKIIDTIYKGGNIMTLIHEEGHANFKRGVESGAIDMQDTINLLRKLDKVMGDRMTKGTTFGRDIQQAKQLRFLKGDAEPTFAQVDEAVAELWEALIMGEGRFGSMRELIKENMKAYAQMGVGNTITNFVKALRHYFNLALTRAMAIKKAVRDGVITEDEINAFRAKMQGTTEQEEINAEARQRFDETLRPAFDESYSIGTAQDATYMDAVNSGDMDKAQSMVDAKARMAGKHFGKWFHGQPSSEKIKSFDPKMAKGFGAEINKIGSWFTLDEKQATEYAGYFDESGKLAQGNVYQTYLFMKNPMEFVDPTGDKTGFAMFGEFMLEGTGKDQMSELTADDVASKKAQLASKGYDGITLTTDQDSLQGADTEQVYAVAFESNQIKSADPVTYDADGNVIPLSQRFDESRDEISFSIGAAQDADYLELAKNPKQNEEKLQAMVDARAEGMGYNPLMKLYHGTKKRFAKFKSDRDANKLIYFSKDRNMAETYPRGYGGHRNPEADVQKRIDDARQVSSNYTEGAFEKLEAEFGSDIPQNLVDEVFKKEKDIQRDALDGMTVTQAQSTMGIRVIEGYVRADKIFEPTNWREFAAEIMESIGVKSESEIEPQMMRMIESGSYMVWENAKVVDAVLSKYDAMTIQESSDGDADTIAFRDPSQIKSADPVTYDADGNVIPLSQRFDESRDEISFSIGDVPAEIENANDPIVKHIFLKEDGKFYEKIKDGYVMIEQSLDQFEGMAIMLHQPDGAMSGTVEVDGDKVVDGKGGVYYPVMFGDQGYFWASTRDAAKGMAKSLNAISKRNNGTILMALTSAPIEKMFSSTTMSTGALDLFHALAKNPKKYGVTKEELNKAIAFASSQSLTVTKTDKKTKVTTTTVKRFPRQLKDTDSLAKNMREMKKNLLPDESIFGQRGAFVQQIADSIAKHMALPNLVEQKKLKGDDKIAFELKKKQALNIAALLASDKNLYNLSKIPKGTLSKASVMQGMADLFAEPLVKTFQQLGQNKQAGRIYAVLEMKGEVEAIEVGDHESYPFALRSTTGEKPIVHVLKNSNRWQDVIYAAPNKKNKDDKNEAQPLYDGNTNAVKKSDESSIFPASAGVSMRELIVRKADEGAESIPLSYSMGDTARHGIMQSIQERVDKPQLKAEMLGDAVRNVQELIDKKNRLVEELKTINEDGKTVAQLNLEEKLRVIESEIGAMDQAYDNDVKRLESEHEIRKGDIGEDIVAQFAHRVDFAKGKKKAELKREAKARESERQKGEGERFKLEKKNLKSRLKAEKANLETEAEKVRTKLATKDKASQRKMIRDMLVTYEALLMALPTDIRGKMGKSVRIVDINTDEKILDFFEKKLDRLERVMDSYIGKKFNKSKDKLFKRATIKKQSGKKDKGKLKHQIHDVFQSAQDASKMTEEKVMAEIASLDSILESQSQEQTLTDSEIEVIKKQKVMIQLFGNWQELSNAEKEAALINGWTDFEYNFTLSKLEQAEERARRLAAIDEAIKSTGVSPEDAKYYEDLKQEEGNKLMSRLKSTGYGLMDFEQFVIKVFGEDSKVHSFVTREQKADAMKIDRMRAHQEAISQMFEEVAGSSTLGVKAAKLQYQMQNTRYVTKTVKRSLTQLQMIQARLMWRQPEGRKHMEGRFDKDGKRITSWSYDQKFMDEIDSLMTNEARAVEQFLMDQYQEEWADLNAVHQRVQNATLPRNYPYAPLTVAPAVRKEGEMVDPLSGQNIKHMNGSNAFLLRRNKGAVAEPVFKDALSTFLVHKTQVEHWMAYAEFNKDFSTIANSREARNSVVAKVGKEGLATLDGWSNIFVNNGLMQSYADSELANMMNRAVSRTTQAILFGRLSVLAIQSTQLGAAAAQMPTMSYTKRLGMLMAGQLEFKKAFNSAFMQRRMKEAPPAVRLAMQNMASGKPNVARAAAEKMGTLIAGTDAFFTAGTYAIIFDYLTTNKGMSEKDAHAQAERLTEQVAQPTRMGRKSLLEMQFSRQPTAKLAWAFASEPRQKMMLMAFRMSENGVFSKEAARAAITTVVFGGVFASLIRTIGADVRDDDDEEVFDAKYWNPTRLALQSVTAPLQGVPVFGDIAEYLLLSSAKALGADTGYLFSGGDMFSNAGDMGLSLVKLGVTMSDLAQQDPDAEIEDALKHLDRFLSGMGVINNNAAAASSFSHLLKDLFMIGKNIAK